MLSFHKTIKLILPLTILSFLLITGCGKNEKPANENQDQTSSVSDAGSKGKYKIKSGIITLKTENSMIKMDIASTLYFDDYGNKESTESYSELSMMGQTIKNHQRNMVLDGYSYNLDLEKKTGTKTKISDFMDPSKFDYTNLSDEIIKQWNIKKEGSESILGKTCEVMSMSNDKMQMTGKVWIWNGITLKSQVEMAGIKISLEATKIEENVSVPADKFVVPEGFQIQEVTMPKEMMNQN